jgi:ATP-dependent Lhr-like helicase
MPGIPVTFHPLIQAWFAETYGKPTAVQAEAWPLIEKGEHVLALAPTGSGKTLTAFLSAISRFCPGMDGGNGNGEAQYPADKLAVLYVSPLKALNEDIRRNLIEPLGAIRARFEQQGIAFPAVRVETRSGDTPQSQRQRFLAHPPSILALTPESLAILLLNPRGRQALATVRYVILDEIHAVLGNKRGSFLSCQIDRLSLLAGEFQRISLSATVRPPHVAAEFVGGIGPDGKIRPVRIVDPPEEKQIELTIEYPDMNEESEQIERYGKRYAGLINYILNRISQRSTILVFTDSRRRAERLTFFLNQEAALAHNGDNFSGPVAFAHHGSLAKELRHSVEQRLARGELPCVVATASLELGIDIGSVDEVALAGSPVMVSQALQRIGRAGHRVGTVSRGRLFPFHGMDLLLATALKEAVDDRIIEAVRPIENPLDILAQIILALCVEKDRSIEELYLLLQKFYIFRNLNHESYIRTVRMLAGRASGSDGEGRLRELKPRIWLDAVDEKIGALEGSLLLLYASGGVIANRGAYSLRLADGTKIGELDEEFVWERRIRDRFYFGGKSWQITGIGPESVHVAPLNVPLDNIPFWHADTAFRSGLLAERVLGILDRYNVPPAEVSALASFLNSQREAQKGIPLPGSTGITVEVVDSPESQGDFFSVVIHSFRGGEVNYPLSLALSQELEETLQLRIESFSNDDAILFLIPRQGIKTESLIRNALMALNGPDPGGRNMCRGERLFRNRLEVSGVFGAHFREAAERSLLLPKAGFGQRTPLWITRQRSKRLFDAVSSADGFPITAEAWRSCLGDMFDMEGFRAFINAINDQSIIVSFFYSSTPSPFSQDVVRQETNSLLYEYDERKDAPGSAGGRSASLSDKVIEEALGSASLRPALKRDLVDGFTARLRREIPGWAPEDELSLCEWVKERIAIPLDEWETLCAVLPEPLQQTFSANTDERLRIIKRDGAAIAAIVHREWESSWNDEPLTLLGPWLRYEGPVSLLRITEVLGVDINQAEDAVNALIEVDAVVRDVTIADSEESAPLFIDRENLDMLLRLSRRKARPEINERPAAVLIPFLALRQGLSANDSAFLKKLAACSAPAKLWETEFCTARCGNYDPEMIDREIREGRLVWYGTGKEKIGICPVDDFDLVYEQLTPSPTEEFADIIPSGFFDRVRDFWEIKEHSGLSSTACAAALWHSVWQGLLSSDSFEPVRRGIAHGFIPTQEPASALPPQGNHGSPRRPQIPRALRDRWKGGAPVRGNWFSLADDPADYDPFDAELRNRDRVRLLLDRWGILCRPLLERESAPFTWSGLLPAMRRMELSGELVAGRFFAGINSLQFASPAIARELENAESLNRIYWINAADPASPAGLNIEGLDSRLPARLPSSRLYYKGGQLIAVTNKNGKEVQFFIPPDDTDSADLIALLKIPRTRKVHPEKKIVLQTINGAEAAHSEYAPLFKTAGFIPDRGRMCFW